MMEFSAGEYAPTVILESFDKFIVDPDGGEVHRMTRTRLMMLREMIDRALNVSQDEIDAA